MLAIKQFVPPATLAGHANNERVSRVLELDALRGLAAVAVLLSHFLGGRPALGEPIRGLLGLGHHGVELFFIISGFVIFMTIEQANSVRAFLVSRVARLYPAYWCGVILTTIAAYGLDGHPPSPADIAVNLTMFQSFFQIRPIDGSYWTLAVEIQFYAAIAIVFSIGMIRHMDVLCLAFLAAASVARIALQAWGVETASWGEPGMARYGFLSYGGLFIAGICLFQMHAKRLSLRTLALLVLAILYSAWWGPTPIHPSTPLEYGATICALVALVWLSVSGRIRVLRWQPFVLLGGVSYPLYLIHERIGTKLIDSLERHGVPAVTSVICVVMLIVALAAAIHMWVEVPCRGSLRRMLSGRRGHCDRRAH